MTETSKIIDGKAEAKQMFEKLQNHVAVLKDVHDITPCLAVILVGDDPASQVYVRNKERRAVKLGMESIVHKLPAKTSQDEVIRLIEKLNDDETVHGILVQLPLPKQIDTFTILRALHPAKDVDGLHMDNVGRLATGRFGLVPCTPQGCLQLLKKTCGSLVGKHAVVVGRSALVGKPLAQLLMRENASVTMLHSKSTNPEKIANQADIVVAAVGVPKLLDQSWFKKDAIVIDVGINRLDDGSLCGDVDFDAVYDHVGKITPVPGGVGPMTIACLMGNTLIAACRQNELALPDLYQ